MNKYDDDDDDDDDKKVFEDTTHSETSYKLIARIIVWWHRDSKQWSTLAIYFTSVAVVSTLEWNLVRGIW